MKVNEGCRIIFACHSFLKHIVFMLLIINHIVVTNNVGQGQHLFFSDKNVSFLLTGIQIRDLPPSYHRTNLVTPRVKVIENSEKMMLHSRGPKLAPAEFMSTMQLQAQIDTTEICSVIKSRSIPVGPVQKASCLHKRIGNWACKQRVENDKEKEI